MPERLLKALNYHTDIEGKGVQEAGTDTGSKNPHLDLQCPVHQHKELLHSYTKSTGLTYTKSMRLPEAKTEPQKMTS